MSRLGRARTLTSSPFIRRVATLVSGTALGQAIVALTSPLLTRLYTPADLGLLAVFVAILSPVLSLASLRYEVSIVLPRSDRTAIQLLYLSIAVTVFASLVTGAIVLVLGGWTANALNVPRLADHFWLLPLSVLTGGLFQSLSYWGIRKKSFGVISQARLTQSLGMVITQLGFGALTLTPLGLFAGDALSRTMGSSRLARDAWAARRELGDPDWAGIRAAAYRYRRFPQFSLGPAVINSFNLQLPALLLSLQFGASPAGFFALGQRILGMPLNLVSTAVGQVFLGDAAEAARIAPDALMGRFTRSAGVLLVVGLLVVIPVAVTAPWLFGILFGERWASAGEYLQLLAPLFIAQFVSAPMGVLLDVLERQDLHLIREIARTILLVGGAVVAAMFSSSPESLVFALSISASLGYIVGLMLVFRALTNVSKSPLDEGGV